MERAAGIEPACLTWKDSALPLSYAREIEGIQPPQPSSSKPFLAVYAIYFAMLKKQHWPWFCRALAGLQDTFKAVLQAAGLVNKSPRRAESVSQRFRKCFHSKGLGSVVSCEQKVYPQFERERVAPMGTFAADERIHSAGRNCGDLASCPAGDEADG